MPPGARVRSLNGTHRSGLCGRLAVVLAVRDVAANVRYRADGITQAGQYLGMLNLPDQVVLGTPQTAADNAGVQPIKPVPSRMKRETTAQPTGTVVAVRGSVVDMCFEGALPAIHTLLRAGDGGRVAIEVLAQRDSRHVRGIALTPTQGLARGMAVEDTGGTLQAPVGKPILSRMFDVFGKTIDRGPTLTDVAWRSVHHESPAPSSRVYGALRCTRWRADTHKTRPTLLAADV